MTDVHILAIDLAKCSVQICATAVGRAVLFNRMVSRAKLETVFREQPPCIVAMEACATSHFCGRFAHPQRRIGELLPWNYATASRIKPLFFVSAQVRVAFVGDQIR